MYRSIAQSGSASALGAEGRRFESYYSDQFCPDGGMVDTLVLEASASCVRVRVSLWAPQLNGENMKKVLLSLLCLSSSIAYAETYTASKKVVCTSDFDELQKDIATSKWKEVLHWGGSGEEKNFFVMFVNEETGTWTFIETNGEHACIIAAGQNSMDVPKKIIPQ